jgi:very-short-patch-repair endonuclease
MASLRGKLAKASLLGEGQGEGLQGVQNEVRQRTDRARELRRESTAAERMLWKHLRNRQLDGLKFRRQVPLLGFYADFFCESANLIVELDGGQHANRMDRDGERTRILQAARITVLRFWNNDVMSNIEGVLAGIARIAKGTTPHPVPLPASSPWRACHAKMPYPQADMAGEGTMLLPERQEIWR